MINEIYGIFVEAGIQKTIIVPPVDKEFGDNNVRMQDARSAVFYAMGEAIKTGEHIAVFLDGDDLASAYTAITEAWFQKAGLVIVALFDKVGDMQTSWLDRCTIGRLSFAADEYAHYLEEIRRLCKCTGPVQINILLNKKKREAYSYDDILKNLRRIGYEGRITCYAPEKLIEETNISCIPSKYRYGIISRYIGSSIVCESGILCCTSECVLVDMNIFRTRYTNSNMKIIVKDQNKVLKVQKILQWIYSNGWTVFEEKKDNADEVYWKFVNSDGPSIMIVG